MLSKAILQYFSIDLQRTRLPDVPFKDEGKMQEVTLGASTEITAVYSEAVEMESARVESVLEPHPDAADGITKCSKHKVYRLIPG